MDGIRDWGRDRVMTGMFAFLLFRFGKDRGGGLGGI
jgi:hypothetical protein